MRLAPGSARASSPPGVPARPVWQADLVERVRAWARAVRSAGPTEARSATVSNAHPAYGSTVNVIVRARARALVTTTAHYKTTDTTHSARASSAGTAVILYRLSRATRGYQVKVSVSVRLGALAGA